MSEQESAENFGIGGLPSAKPRTGLSPKGLLLALLAGIPITIGMLVILGTVLSSLTPSAQATNPATLSSRPLEGIAAWKSNGGFRICTRQEIHNCRVRFGFSNGGEGTFEFTPTIIKPVTSCDTQVQQGFAACPDGSLLGDKESRGRLATCLLQWGLIVRDESTMHAVDPRDPQLPPGTMRLDCAEGYKEFSFADVM